MSDRSAAVDEAIDRDELYDLVRVAVKDALLDVLGTVALLVIAFGTVAAGASAVFGTGSTAGIVVGIALVIGGIGLAAYALDVTP